MKIILNDSSLEITSRILENRHKVSYPFNISNQNKWSSEGNGFFIDIKLGDEISLTSTISTFVAAFVSSNAEPVAGEALSFANGTSERTKSTSLETTAVENCYLYVNKMMNGLDREPIIEINGMTLNEDGYLE